MGTSAHATPTRRDEWQAKTEIFKVSYDEVLSAVKHHDDKLNRMLTGIAFLTAAGITVYTQLRDSDDFLPLMTFDRTSLDVSTFFFIAFLVSVALALLLTLAGLGPTSHFGSRDPAEKQDYSLIYFALIAEDKGKKWAHLIDRESAVLREALARNYHREAQDISRRVEYKIARTREASAFLHLVVSSLGLMGIFSLTDLGAEARWWIATGFLLFLMLLPVWDMWRMTQSRFTLSLSLTSASYVLLLVTILATALLLVFGHQLGWSWWAVGYALGALLFSRMALVRPRHAPYWLASAMTTGIALLLLVGGASVR
ncbi:MAG TPA: hypothetical protein VIG64_11410 [Actinomycetota bacterium]|jgi:hypothetical protein